MRCSSREHTDIVAKPELEIRAHVAEPQCGDRVYGGMLPAPTLVLQTSGTDRPSSEKRISKATKSTDAEARLLASRLS